MKKCRIRMRVGVVGRVATTTTPDAAENASTENVANEDSDTAHVVENGGRE